MLTGKRSERVGDLISREVSLILDRELKDPRLGFVTITGTDVTDDLRFARVYVTILGDESQVQESLKGLKSAEGFVQHLIGERIRLKYVPKISFHIDDSDLRGARIDQLLKEVMEEDLT